MTVFGKCGVCRKRKVKCDEKRPTCIACRTKGRTCQYRKAGSSRSSSHEVVGGDDFGITAPKQAARGRGEYAIYNHTLEQSEVSNDGGSSFSLEAIPDSSWSPSPPLLCPQSSLATRWGSVFGYEALSLNPLGDWVQVVFLRIGLHTCLDDACEYTLQSMLAFKYDGCTSSEQLYMAHGRALRSLRLLLNSTLARTNILDAMLAIMLIYAAEIITSAEVCDEYTKDVARDVTGLIYEDEARGLHSHPEPLLDTSFDLNVALATTRSLLIEVPGLICMVRAAAQFNSKDEDAARKAICAVQSLYDCDRDIYVRETLHKHTTSHACLSDECQSLFHMLLTFDCLDAYVLATRYRIYEVLICGLAETLGAHDYSTMDIDLEAVEDRDIAAARSLAMCLDYALRPSSAQPLATLAILIPIQMALAT
ncbi:hypothetical protein K431DRAFT_345771 [Polychaeton citri CBS 116435]|uniref:Zn(2)-C6 fungal-type domain-containing protein n=1 Tax=Polychaeton citri CBS 116435 TaxID=1314669 RepID=A0A9P4QAP0_9PEZI|nr:hypothetical protein K431DRAFT_345771 [Polychaeton citri CBS 116435]